MDVVSLTDAFVFGIAPVEDVDALTLVVVDVAVDVAVEVAFPTIEIPPIGIDARTADAVALSSSIVAAPSANGGVFDATSWLDGDSFLFAFIFRPLTLSSSLRSSSFARSSDVGSPYTISSMESSMVSSTISTISSRGALSLFRFGSLFFDFFDFGFGVIFLFRDSFPTENSMSYFW